MFVRNICLICQVITALSAALPGYAATAGAIRFSGRLFAPGCMIAQQAENSLQISCERQARSIPLSAAAFNLPENRGDARMQWLNPQHSQADLIVRYR